MHIGVDARALVGDISGVGNYLANVLEAGAFDGHAVSAYYDPCADGDTFDLTVPDGTRFRWQPVTIPEWIESLGSMSAVWWVNVSLYRRLRTDDVDAFFGPNFVQPLAFSKPSVVVVHDMVHRRYPETHPTAYHWYLRVFLTASIARADHVVTVSENTRRDLLDYHDVSASAVTVASNAASSAYRPRNLNATTQARLREEYDLPEKFLLYVGNIEPRKNLATLLRALGTFTDDDRPPLVIVGQKHLDDRAFARAYCQCSFVDDVTFTGYVETDDLLLLYNLATVFVYPSLYEGFGLPALEALQSGVAVVTSNHSSLPEVVGEAALTANPENPESVADAIARLWTDPARRDEYRGRGLRRATQFSWDDTAATIASIFGSLCCDGRRTKSPVYNS